MKAGVSWGWVYLFSHGEPVGAGSILPGDPGSFKHSAWKWVVSIRASDSVPQCREARKPGGYAECWERWFSTGMRCVTPD